MANLKNAKKAIKVQERNRIQNQTNKTRFKTAVLQAELALENNDKEKGAIVKTALRVIDKSVSKGIIHKNKAARKKSKLSLALHSK